MDQPLRLDSRPATGNTPSDPLRDFVIRKGREAPVPDSAPVLIFLMGAILLWWLSSLLWLILWLSAGTPAVAWAGPSPQEVAVACALGGVALFHRRRSRPARWRAVLAGLYVVAALFGLRFIDFRRALAGAGPAKPVTLFVETAQDWSLSRGSSSLEPVMTVRGLTEGRDEVVIPQALLARVNRGRTCIHAAVRVKRGYAFLEAQSVETSPPASSRLENRARCLHPAAASAAPGRPST